MNYTEQSTQKLRYFSVYYCVIIRQTVLRIESHKAALNSVICNSKNDIQKLWDTAPSHSKTSFLLTDLFIGLSLYIAVLIRILIIKNSPN